MPDSFPPLTWGPPFDERDLDGLLSGDIADTPLALRQVADALTALRAAPTRAELSGEAAARAEFRALAEVSAAEPNEAPDDEGLAHTLALMALVPYRAGRRPARHRGGRGAGHARPQRARPPGRRLGMRGGLLAAATAALIVAAITVTGNLPGPIHPLGHSSAAGTPSARHSSLNPSGSQSLQAGSATPEPSHKPAPTPARETPSGPAVTPTQSEASDLCRTYYEYLLHPQPHDAWSAQFALLWRIAKLAGDPFHFDVNSYCAPYVRGMFPPGLPGTPGGQPNPQPGSQDHSGGGNQGNSQKGPGNN